MVSTMIPKRKDNMEQFVHEIGEEGAANAVASVQECTGLLVNRPESAEADKTVMNLYQTEISNTEPNKSKQK